MSEHAPFVCHDCGERVSSTAYRSACPNCDGTLRSAATGGGRRDVATSVRGASGETSTPG